MNRFRGNKAPSSEKWPKSEVPRGKHGHGRLAIQTRQARQAKRQGLQGAGSRPNVIRVPDRGLRQQAKNYDPEAHNFSAPIGWLISDGCTQPIGELKKWNGVRRYGITEVLRSADQGENDALEDFLPRLERRLPRSPRSCPFNNSTQHTNFDSRLRH